MAFGDPLTFADVDLVAPIFSSSGLHPQSEARKTMFLEQAEECTEREFWGTKADLAVLLLTAHFLHCDIRDNETAIVGAPAGASTPTYAGAIASESVGPVTRSFGAGGGASFVQGGAAAFSDEAMATTPWGQRYIELRQTLLGAGAY